MGPGGEVWGRGKGARPWHSRYELCASGCGDCEQLLAGLLAKCVNAACSLGWLELKEKLKRWLAGM